MNRLQWLSGLVLSAALVLVFVAFGSNSANAQGIATGSISGTVVDPAGAAVPGSKVSAVNTATQYKRAPLLE